MPTPSLTERIKAHAAQRPTLTVDLRSFLASEVEGAIKMRALNVAEDSDAAKAAVEFRKGVLSSLPAQFVQEFLSDPTFLDDARCVEKLWRASRDSADTARPAFPSAQWMREQMTHEELQALYGFYERAVERAGRTPEPIGEDEFTFLYHGVAANAERDVDRILLPFTKPVLADLFVRLAVAHVALLATMNAGVQAADATAS